MYDAILDEARLIGEVSVQDLDGSVQKATDALLRLQHADGHFVFELEADATIPSEYILLRHYLAEPDDLELERKIGVYLRRVQGEHGGWPLYHDGAFNVSASVKAYFALKMIGDDIDAPHMARARDAILAAGGAAATNVFTRIQLALYGEIDWVEIPNMPAELILAPRWFPIHLSKMSYWARTVIVPLLVLMNLRPQARNPRGVHVPELILPTVKARRVSNVRRPEARLDHRVQRPGRRAEGDRGPLAQAAAQAGHRWLRGLRGRTAERRGRPGRHLSRHGQQRDDVRRARLCRRPTAPRHRAPLGGEAARRQGRARPTASPASRPIWDTALAAHALMEAGVTGGERKVERALNWLRARQVLDVKGDWAEVKPDVRPGGWAFQYNNAHYPDLDDTAVVVMAMDRARDRLGIDGNDEAIARGEEWVAGLQSADGGFAAFDADNTFYYLNNIPFADHGALLDPPTVDVAARCVGMLAQLGEPLDSPRMAAAIKYLRDEQEADGSWWGRWGVNYIYGTWSALVRAERGGRRPRPIR